MSTVITPFQGTDPFSTATFNNRISQINTGFSYISNPNLLDNWYFGNPVDQRQGRVVKPNITYYSDNTLATSAGTTSAYVTAYRYATGTASGVNYASFKLEDTDTAPTYYAAPENVVRGYAKSGYTIDRWIMFRNNVFDVDTSTFHFCTGQTYQQLGQNIENWKDFVGKAVTMSVVCSTDTDFYARIVWGNTSSKVFKTFVPAGTNGLVTVTGVIPDEALFIAIQPVSSTTFTHTSGSVTIKAVKFELGSQQTLAHQENGVWVLNEIPDYGEQLARCQRYLYVAKGMYRCTNCDANNGCFFHINLPVKMRTTPSLIMPSSFIVLSGVTNSVISTFVNHKYSRGNSESNVQINLKDTSNNKYSLDYSIYCNDKPIYISAEL